MKWKMAIIISCLVIGLGVFIGVTVLGKSSPNLKVAAGELQIEGYSFTIKPSKYTYQDAKVETFKTTVRNLSDKEAWFDMGDGIKIVIPAHLAYVYWYTMPLDGDTVRIPITRIPSNDSGLRVEERLILKLEPIKPGGTM